MEMFGKLANLQTHENTQGDKHCLVHLTLEGTAIVTSGNHVSREGIHSICKIKHPLQTWNLQLNQSGNYLQ